MCLIFILRAAVKMANMDSAFEYMFTEPKTQDGVSICFQHF